MAELNVSRKTISKLFSEMQGKKYIIPDYQRPYKWDKEKCETLWIDITNFFQERNKDDEYFLGTIVTCKNDDVKNEIEIIDGQQRVTSLLLLLRAFYKKIELMQEDDNIVGLKSQIAPCIWDVDEISKKVKDRTTIHIESKVATAADNDEFHKILESGEIYKDSQSLYSQNYEYFYDRCEDFAKVNPLHWQALSIVILEKCIVLPIECENQDTALTIFSTLNDRGLPLSDSDIFKAQIYRAQNSEESKRVFTESWKELTESCKDAKVTLDELFRFYSHIIRASNQDKSKEIGLRKYYSLNKYEKLKNPNLMKDLQDLCDFWRAVNLYESKLGEKEIFSTESLKYLHCLQCYSNEFWRYILSVYYYKYKERTDFSNIVEIFLKKLTSFLFYKFIEKPTVNAIKDEIYSASSDIFHDQFDGFNITIDSNIKELIKNSNQIKNAKGIILLHAYLNKNQRTLILQNFEVEHVFPRKWQDSNYNGWNKEEAESYLEKFGNKVAIEKKINIQAGNGYFGEKKRKYSLSTISDILDLSKFDNNDWLKVDIESRDENFSDNIATFFKSNQ
ncbi:DUF262 domain-containing protein [Leptospira yasudae]|uniref:DUF262 domain-containing protein n=1 Tax=Leptospira yasudae TaxID=2202201 RepID=UPI001C4ED320|nr:DUF262 domain-containing protein [Leptospira yasudae]MBW0436012.1 DUF262 domain-containing protein [Leptospira yasudae]